MEIKKILNNNVAIVTDRKGNEIVVMGKGLAFHKKIGDFIEETAIEKSFILDDKTINDKLGRLISEIPLEHLAISEDIIHYAEEVLGKKLDETIYLTLTDHIHFAIVRQKQNIVITNKLLWEIKRFYKQEYQIGLHALEMIKKRLGVILSEDEAGSIAIHIANAQTYEEMSTTVNMIKIMQDILNIVKYHFIIDFDEESLVYFRFLTHIKFFAQRLLNSDSVGSDDDTLYEIIKMKCPEAFECTEKVKTYIKKYYEYDITNEEMVYLTMHINRLIGNDKR